jgi:shikimate kinase
MGAGKSTIGHLLAMRTGWDFLDLDTHIETATGKSAKELFANLGESGFRQLESEILVMALQRSKIILAPGGAVIDRDENQHALANSIGSFIVFLDAPFQTLIERCLEQERAGRATYRPLLHETTTATAKYKSRRLLYTAHAGLTVDVAENSRDEVVELIFGAISKPRQ